MDNSMMLKNLDILIEKIYDFSINCKYITMHIDLLGTKSRNAFIPEDISMEGCRLSFFGSDNYEVEFENVKDITNDHDSFCIKTEYGDVYVDFL